VCRSSRMVSNERSADCKQNNAEICVFYRTYLHVNCQRTDESNLRFGILFTMNLRFLLIRREDQRMWAWLLAQSGVDTPSSAVFLISFINLAFRTTDGQKKRLSDAKLTGRHLIFIPTSLDFHIAVNELRLRGSSRSSMQPCIRPIKGPTV